jgi:predicted  nucleic acid-binding Zn-ribbon protein
MKEGNEMSDTPRTDKIENDWKESWDRSTGQQEMADFARQLERELNEAKRERDHLCKELNAAEDARDCNAAECEKLERELNAFHGELSKVMPSDYKDWWQNSKAEWPLVARLTIQNLREREQSALEDLERLERELNEARAALASDYL